MNTLVATVNRLAEEFDYWTLKLPAKVLSEEIHKHLGCCIIEWPFVFVMETDNKYKGVLSTIDFAGLQTRNNLVTIEKDDPFIVKGFSEAKFAVYGTALLEEHNIVEFMGDKVLEHYGWVCILPETRVRRLTKKEKELYEKSSDI
jgi:hypothetical protein